MNNLVLTTPISLSKDVEYFCSQINSQQTPIFIDTKMDNKWSDTLNGIPRIKNGNHWKIYGWVIRELPNKYLEGELNYISGIENEILVIPTRGEEEKLLFLPENRDRFHRDSFLITQKLLVMDDETKFLRDAAMTKCYHDLEKILKLPIL